METVWMIFNWSTKLFWFKRQDILGVGVEFLDFSGPFVLSDADYI